ncbi:MAG: hypothetical protein ACFFEF_01180 [Candidatus Thorarchaeota archaeon]
MSPKRIALIALYAVALAMGVMSMVLPMLGQAVDLGLIGLAVTCLGIAGLSTSSGDS